ncbi:NDxxF motif lipoprotein [Priestia aryabhattai]|uniref:NDxxF motif lipoprotein n=1 Tax=Priestia aryabhattai TaxID=412384 RepID=A0AAX6NDU5_PRIAR|nr:NDxxF motif lipoprotein [Priestia aryabhattai]MDU9694068.1 NDxxF motif lipoprotein [Priestia aryabhattai]
MKKILISVSLLFVMLLGACSQEESSKEVSKEIVVPTSIFSSAKKDSLIQEEEMKKSIETYLNSNERLSNVSDQFDDVTNSDGNLNKENKKKLKQVKSLIRENDANFSSYISHNTLPSGYEKASQRIYKYIQGTNQMLEDVDQAIDNIDEDSYSDLDIDLIISKDSNVSGREQKKIEKFLDKNEIDTIAFGRGN